MFKKAEGRVVALTTSDDIDVVMEGYLLDDLIHVEQEHTVVLFVLA